MSKPDSGKRWVNDEVRQLFAAEISNERNGGVTPATVFSSIDSLLQAPSCFFDDDDLLSCALGLLGIVAYGEDLHTEVRDLL